MKLVYKSSLPRQTHGYMTVHESDDGYLLVTTHETSASGFENTSEFRLAPNSATSYLEVAKIVDILNDWLVRSGKLEDNA